MTTVDRERPEHGLDRQIVANKWRSAVYVALFFALHGHRQSGRTAAFRPAQRSGATGPDLSRPPGLPGGVPSVDPSSRSIQPAAT